MEIKCPKCRFKFIDKIPSGLNEYSCVCPRCGTPFTFNLNTEKENISSRHTLPYDFQEVIPLINKEYGNNNLASQQKTSQQKTAQNKHVVGIRFSENIQTDRNNDKYLRRLVVAFCVSVIPVAILLLFTLTRCVRNPEISGVTGNPTDHIQEIDTSSVYTDVPSHVYERPVPQWVKGVWKGEAQLFTITLEISDTQITETSGEKKSHGIYQYSNGRLYCKFPENSTYTYIVNEDTHTISAGEGILLYKQN